MPHSDIGLKVKMTEKALRNRIIGDTNVPAEAITCYVPTHARGKAEMMLGEMVTHNEGGWEEYGGRGTYHITDVEEAVQFIESNGGNLPFGFQDSNVN